MGEKLFAANPCLLGRERRCRSAVHLADGTTVLLRRSGLPSVRSPAEDAG
jgi:hypothetical protein